MTTRPTFLHVEYQHRPTLEINYGTPDLPGFPREKWPTWEFSQSTLQMSPEYGDDKPTQTTTVSSLQCSEVPGIHRVINATDYSTYLKILRVTAYTCRFIDNCSRQVASRVTSSLTTIEIHDVEKRWLKSCQATQFQDEIANIQTNSRNSRLPLVKTQIILGL